MTWTKAQIRELLEKNDRAVLKGIVAIHSYQTNDEQVSESARWRNSVGWSAVDAEFMTSLANQIRRRGALTAKQMPYARRIIKKYARQLTLVANEKGANA